MATRQRRYAQNVDVIFGCLMSRTDGCLKERPDVDVETDVDVDAMSKSMSTSISEWSTYGYEY